MSSGTVTTIPARMVPEGTSLATILRGLAKQRQAGWPRKPVDFYITAGDYWSRRLHGSLYVKGVGYCDLTDEQWRRVCALSARYRAYHQYRTEVAPGWRDEAEGRDQ